MRYSGSDTQLAVDFAESSESFGAGFEEANKKRFGFVMEGKSIFIEPVSVEIVGVTERVSDPCLSLKKKR